MLQFDGDRIMASPSDNDCGRRGYIGGSTYKNFRGMPPIGSNSFVFTYIFTEKCPCRRSTAPHNRSTPPTGNPGSAPGLRPEWFENVSDKLSDNEFCQGFPFFANKTSQLVEKSVTSGHLWSALADIETSQFKFLIGFKGYFQD